MRVVVCGDIEAPRQMVWDYIVDPCDLAWTSITGVDHRGRWRLRRRNEGVTNLELGVAYHVRGGIVAHLADRVASPIVEGHLRRSLKELKVRVERRQVS
jgi:uncharacterized membrane protein